jgi:hypothetical protein
MKDYFRQAQAGGGDALPRGPRLERALLPFGLLPRLGVRDLCEERPPLALQLLGQRVEHVHGLRSAAAGPGGAAVGLQG